MHYGRRAFSRTGGDTITPKNPSARIGQRRALSPIDIWQLNKLYQCSGTPATPRKQLHLHSNQFLLFLSSCNFSFYLISICWNPVLAGFLRVCRGGGIGWRSSRSPIGLMRSPTFNLVCYNICSSLQLTTEVL